MPLAGASIARRQPSPRPDRSVDRSRCDEHRGTTGGLEAHLPLPIDETRELNEEIIVADPAVGHRDVP